MVIGKSLSFSLSFAVLCVVFSVKPSITVRKVISSSYRLITCKLSNPIRKNIAFSVNRIKVLGFVSLA